VSVTFFSAKYSISQTGRIRDDEDIDAYRGMSEEEIQEVIRKREARSHLQILEMV
jgi:hypothetical protein